MTPTDHGPDDARSAETYAALKATDRLPSPKGVALEAIRLTRREDVTALQIARVIQADPALAARVIRNANSPALGRGRPIGSVADAALVLGLPAVRSLALAFALVDAHRRGACRAFDYEGFWADSLLRALAVQTLAARARLAGAEEGFACGLLAEVGRLALATVHPDEYAVVLEGAPGAEGAALAQAERRALGIDHYDLGLAMLRDWGFPRVFLAAMEQRSAESEAADGHRQGTLAGIFRLADAVVRFSRLDPAARETERAALVHRAAGLELDEAAFGGVMDEILGGWREWAPILELPADRMAGLAPPARTAGIADAVPLRILVADGEAGAAAALRGLLEAEGHTVMTAGDGRTALASALGFRPHVLVADAALPGIDGAALTHALRETRLGHRLQVIMLVPPHDESAAVQALEAGADHCVERPAPPRLLVARLRAAQRLLREQETMAADADDVRRLAAELALHNRRLEQSSLKDALTDLPNRRYAVDRLEQEWAAATRAGVRLALVAIGLDGVDAIGDKKGAGARDAFLRSVAAALRGAARRDDVVCRSGKGFVVILSGSAGEQAERAAERLRAAAAAVEDPRGGRAVVHVAAASGTPGNGTPAQLLADVERALEEARKRTARKR